MCTRRQLRRRLEDAHEKAPEDARPTTPHDVAPEVACNHPGDFCLSCHTDTGLGGMGFEALALRADVMLEHDPRRQPFQPPARVYASIPAGWIRAGDGPGNPMGSMLAPDDGVQIDRWILPNAP